VPQEAISREPGPSTAKNVKGTEEKCMNKVSFEIGGVKPKSQCMSYIISRAFIPPWSLVTTKPETLGPDALFPVKEQAGTLVSLYCDCTGWSKAPARNTVEYY
jgi:hypothetical protein